MHETKDAQTFDRYASDYQQLLDQSVSISGEGGEYFAGVKAAYVAKILGAGFSGRILDFGCGVGLLSRALARQLPSATVDGFDSSSASIAAVDSELASAGSFTSIREEVRQDYDTIVVANVLHHVPPPERPDVLDFVGKHLSRSGCLFVFEHNPANPITRLAVDRCPFDEDAILLRPSETRTLFREAGLGNIRRDYIVFFPRTLKMFRPLERFLEWCPAGAQYVVSGVKP